MEMHPMHLSLRIFKNREVDELYVSISLKSFAMSMVSLFVPIYLMNIGYSITYVVLFYLIWSLIHLVMLVPVALMGERLGFKKAFFISSALLVFYYYGLQYLPQHPFLYYILSVVYGIQNAFYWFSYHIDFSYFSDKGKEGEEIGIARILSLISSVIAPIIASGIIILFGYDYLFLISSFILFISPLPLFFTGDVKERENISFKYILLSIRKHLTFRWERNNKLWKDSLAFIAKGIESGVNIAIWPVFIFLYLAHGSYSAVGYVYALNFLIAIITTYVVGKTLDVKSSFILNLSAILNAVMWLVRSVIKALYQLFIVDSFYSLISNAVYVSFDAISYKKAREIGRIKYILMREMSILSGRVLCYLSIILFLSSSYKLIFVLTALVSLLFSLLSVKN